MKFTHNAAAGRYEVWQDGELAGETHYTLAGNQATFDRHLILAWPGSLRPAWSRCSRLARQPALSPTGIAPAWSRT